MKSEHWGCKEEKNAKQTNKHRQLRSYFRYSIEIGSFKFRTFPMLKLQKNITFFLLASYKKTHDDIQSFTHFALKNVICFSSFWLLNRHHDSHGKVQGKMNIFAIWAVIACSVSWVWDLLQTKDSRAIKRQNENFDIYWILTGFDGQYLHNNANGHIIYRFLRMNKLNGFSLSYIHKCWLTSWSINFDTFKRNQVIIIAHNNAIMSIVKLQIYVKTALRNGC